MRHLIAVMLVCPACFCACARQATGPAASTGDNKTSPELAQLAGSWLVTAIEAGGQSVPSDRVEKLGLQYVFENNKVTIRRPDRPDAPNTFILDAAANPRRITIQQTPPIRAIFALDGDSLKLCLMTDENPNSGFPGELVSKAVPKTDLLTLKRKIPAPASAVAAPATPPIPATSPSPTLPTTNPPASSAASPANPPTPAAIAKPAAGSATSPANDRRTAWRYENAPKIFPNQPTTAGVFRRQEGLVWLEERKDAPTQDWKEMARTPEYLELARPVGDFRVRLYTDRSTYKFGNEPDWKPMFAGGWLAP